MIYYWPCFMADYVYIDKYCLGILFKNIEEGNVYLK